MTSALFGTRGTDSIENGGTDSLLSVSTDLTTNAVGSTSFSNSSVINTVNGGNKSTGPTELTQIGLISKAAYDGFKNTLWFFIVPTISVIGIFGNICGIWFLLHEKLRQPFHVYLFALISIDLIFLLLSAVRNGLIIGEHFDRYLADRLSCYYSAKLRHTQSTVYNTCAYLISLMSFERLVNIIFPLRVKIFRVRSYTIFLIVVICILTAAFAWPTFVLSEPKETKNPVTNVITCISVRSQWAKDHQTFIHVYMQAALIIARFIPAGVTSFANMALCIYLARQRSLRTELFEKKANKGEISEQLKITITLLLLSICLVLSLVPTATASILSNYYPETYGRKGHEYYTQQFLRDLGYLVRVISAANDFFIYVMMSKASRRTFKKMLWSTCCRLYVSDVNDKGSRTSSRVYSTKLPSSNSRVNTECSQTQQY